MTDGDGAASRLSDSRSASASATTRTASRRRRPADPRRRRAFPSDVHLARALRRRRRLPTRVTDAVLGAAGAGDIGEMFPDTDPANAGRDSIEMLALAVERVARRGLARGAAWTSSSSPRRRGSAPHRDAMRAALAGALGVAAGGRQRQGQDERGHGLDRPRRRNRLHGRRDARSRVADADVQALLDWLVDAAAGGAATRDGAVAAAIENIVPAHSRRRRRRVRAVSRGARTRARILGAFLAVVGRQRRPARWSCTASAAATAPAWIERRFARQGRGEPSARLRELYDRYGLLALFLSRFVPGVRAIVPPFAGALRAAVSVRSLDRSRSRRRIWYGLDHRARVPRRLRLGARSQRDIARVRTMAPPSSRGAIAGGGRRRMVIATPARRRDDADADAASRAFLLERFDDFLALEQGASPRTQRGVSRATSRGSSSYADVTRRRGAARRHAAQLLRDFVYHLKDLGLVAGVDPAQRLGAAHLLQVPHRRRASSLRDPSERLETPKRWRTLPEVLTRRRGREAARRADAGRPAVLPRPRDARAGVRRRAPRLGVDHDRRAGRAARGGARARVRQGEQGAARADRPVARSARSRSTCASCARRSRRAAGRACSSSTRAASR